MYGICLRGIRQSLDMGMWSGKIIQATNVMYWNAQSQRRLTVRGEERAVFRGMLECAHRYMESLLDLRDGTFNINDQTVCMRASHGQAIGCCEIEHSLVICCCGTKLFSKLRYAEKIVKIRAGWVIEPAEQITQCRLIAKRQHDRELHALGGWQYSHRHGLPAGNNRTHMVMQNLELLSSAYWINGLGNLCLSANEKR